MQHDHLYLQDILDAAETVATFVARTDRETFLANPEKQSAVAFQFMVIGEAVRNLSDELKDRYPEIPWSNARRLRNLIAHHYFAIDWSIIWDTATSSVPHLRSQVLHLFSVEFEEEDD